MSKESENSPGRFASLMSGGVPLSASVILPLIYDELRELAHRALAGERAGITLQTTALVHEVYLKLGADANARWENKRHYYLAAAMCMRRILVDHARARKAQKRGGVQQRIPLEDVDRPFDQWSPDWDDLDDALRALEERDPDMAHHVGLRYFAGLSVDQTAAVLGTSASTLAREWRVARAFLERHIREKASKKSEDELKLD